jgi:hypothetical protein
MASGMTPCSVVKDPNISEKLAVPLRTNVVYIQVSKLTTEPLGPEEVGQEVSEPTFCYQMSDISCLDLKQL